MLKRNIEIVEKLPNEKMIVRVEQEIEIPQDDKKIIKKIVKFAMADKNGTINISDLNGNFSEIHFFDTYKVNELGDVIIGVKKDACEYNERVLSHYNLDETRTEVKKSPGGGFDIGPYAKEYYEIKEPTKNIEDIVPQSYSFNYGIINRYGQLTIYPLFDDIQFGNEDTCIVGLIGGSNLKFGYNDIITGKYITPVCFNKAGKFNDGRAVVRYERKYGYIDRDKIITNPKNSNEYAENLEPKFFWASDFKDGEASVCVALANHFTSSVNAKIDQSGTIWFVSDAKTYRKSFDS